MTWAELRDVNMAPDVQTYDLTPILILAPRNLSDSLSQSILVFDQSHSQEAFATFIHEEHIVLESVPRNPLIREIQFSIHFKEVAQFRIRF